jgi:lipopolysaccharide transport system ATP-binding protein
MKPIIRVENLSKQYRIGAKQASYATLRESLTDAIASPFRRVKNTRNSKPETQNSETIWALKDINFEVMPGEVVGIIGRNGAGKSTLLKILSRISEPSTGKVDLYGRVSSLLEVGTGFHPELTGRENIYLNGAVLGMKRAEITCKFDEIVAFAEIEKFLDTTVKHYSSGMYMRLAFSVAAHLEPEILVIDEVLAVGDAEFQNKCLGKMGAVAKEGRTVLFVSHSMAAIQQLCSCALLIQSGVLHRQGAPETVVASYLSDARYSKDGRFDFSNHPARSLRHHPIIRNLSLFSANGFASSGFLPNDSLTIELTIEPKIPIREPRVAVAIEDNLGRRIMTLASYFQNSRLADIETTSQVRCTLPNLCLGSGRYLISVSIGDKYQGLLDSLDSAAWFEVAWQNNYGNGEPYHPIYGPVLANSVWECMH